MPNQRAEIRPERSVRYKGRVYKRGDEDALVEAGFGSDDSKSAAGVGPNKQGQKASSGKDMVQRLTDRGDIVGFGASAAAPKSSSRGAETLGVKPGEKVALGAGARRQNNAQGQDTQRPENGGDGDEPGRTGGSRDLANRTSSDAGTSGASGDETSGGSKSSSGSSKRSSSGTGGRKRGK